LNQKFAQAQAHTLVARDVTEPANIRMYKIRRMRICRAIKITSYYSYCN